MPPIPKERSFDCTIALLRDPYGFGSDRARRCGSDLFEARLLGRRTLCATGPLAAELLRDPIRLVHQRLTGERLRDREQLRADLVDEGRLGALVDRVDEEWDAHARRWATQGRVALYDALPELLTRAACAWSGVPLTDEEASERARDLVVALDHGPLGPLGWRARRRLRGWLARSIREIRSDRLPLPREAAAWTVAWHRDPDGGLLPLATAANELFELIRSIVATAPLATFVAHALHLHPESRDTVLGGDAEYIDWFVREVRRSYPIVPAALARVRHDFEWRGFAFARGRLVRLDLYGIDHDPRLWDAPERFRPERFRPSRFVARRLRPNPAERPIERIALALGGLAARILTTRLAYEVPAQDLRIDRHREPAHPRDRFVVVEVRPRWAA